MALKPLVDTKRLLPPIRKKLTHIENVFLSVGSELIITSTHCDLRSPGYLPCSNLAIDANLPRWDVDLVFSELKRVLGEDYVVVLEQDHFHIEYCPK